ncbi:hypothetical protein [Nocardia blacklockiae]|uniref:hypothetical protein n=1 Tax=Nocardia blacklockiae TaxID=480036 RepID=UPI001894FBE0|nr:hypothetical protein [Nocardia blacklockiae]MBF6171955.1 hypothetical protein [Nocardia blacklockiae]
MTDIDGRTSGLRIPRSRGALGGLAVFLLGIWGALIPFIGPYFDFGYTPDEPWVWSAARGWLQVLPGVVAAIGGLLMLSSGNRAVAITGAWLAAAAGAWFVIGPALAGPFKLGDIGTPLAGSDWKQALIQLTLFSGLGAVILFFAATSLGRLSVRSVRDLAFGRRRAETTANRPATAVADPAEGATASRNPRTGLHRPLHGGTA